MKRGPMLLVHWKDVESRHLGWARKKKMKKAKAPVAKTLGWELKRRKKKGELLMVSTHCKGDGSLLTVIPIGMIIGEWIVEPVAVRVKK